MIVPLCPFQKIAPPERLAVLSINVTLETTPSRAPLFQSIAPPLVPAVLFLNKASLNVTFVQFSVSLPCKNIAPPRY